MTYLLKECAKSVCDEGNLVCSSPAMFSSASRAGSRLFLQMAWCGLAGSLCVYSLCPSVGQNREPGKMAEPTEMHLRCGLVEPKETCRWGLNSPAGSRVGNGLVQCSRHRNASIGGVKPLLRKAVVTVETRQVACITGAVLVKNQKSPIR